MARWIRSSVSGRIPNSPASIFTIVRGFNPQRAASSSWLIRRAVRSRRTFAPNVLRSASFATLWSRDNGGFLKRITWLEREIDTGADHAEIVVGAAHDVLKCIQFRSLLSAQDRTHLVR